MASMLPSALDMHKFERFMKKDEIFENPNGYKIVSKVRSFKEKERIEYLLSTNLSKNWNFRLLI